LISFNLVKLLTGDSTENINLGGKDRVVVYAYEAMKKKPFFVLFGIYWAALA
jgi:hypothetical protein